MDSVFLDANVLFSAAYRPNAGLRKLWQLEHITLISSRYAAEEASRNLPHNAQRAELKRLLTLLELVAEPPQDVILPQGITLPDKDLPILRAALTAGATHLLTGDVQHFGSYFGQRLAGMWVLPPGEYLRQVQ